MSTGQDFTELCKKVINSVLKYGRVGLLVDAVEKNTPYIAVYEPQHITNWRSRFIDGREQLTLLVLREVVNEIKEDGFSIKPVETYRSFHLIDGVVEVHIWRKDEKSDDWMVVESSFPKVRGKALDRIEFTFIGAKTNSSKVDKPPLLDLAHVNLNHWRLSVDYNHGLHFCALPTPWAAGFRNDEGSSFGIGPVEVWMSEDPQASCGFLEFSGAGLASVSQAMKETKEEMAVLGARIIEQTRSQIETAEAARIRQSGESGALAGLANNISAGLTESIHGIARWIGKPDTDAYVKLPTDFNDAKLSPQELTALLQTWQAGAISLDTFLWNLQTGELLSPGRKIEDEKLHIEAEGNKPFSPGEET